MKKINDIIYSYKFFLLESFILFIQIVTRNLWGSISTLFCLSLLIGNKVYER